MSDETDINETLQDAWDLAQEQTGIYTNRFNIQFMGWVKGKDNIKNGRYLDIQNFRHLPTAKKKGNGSAFRITFRSMYLVNEDGHFLEVVKWVGGNENNVDETTQYLFGPKRLIYNAFVTLMCDALRNSVSTDQPY